MLDAATGDYTEQGLTEPLQNDLYDAVVLRIDTPLGSYFADPQLGSKLHLLKRAKLTERTVELAKKYVLDALEPLKQTQNLTAIQLKIARFVGSELFLMIQLDSPDGSGMVMGHKYKVGG